MLFTKNSTSNYAASFNAITPPDTLFSYSSGTSNMLAQKLRYILFPVVTCRETFDQDLDYWSFPRNFLFDKIGMNSAFIEPDAHGTFVGSSFGYATSISHFFQ